MRCTAATNSLAVNLLNFGKKHTKILDKVKVKLAQLRERGRRTEEVDKANVELAQLRQRVNDLACDDMAAPLVAWQLHDLL